MRLSFSGRVAAALMLLIPGMRQAAYQPQEQHAPGRR